MLFDQGQPIIRHPFWRVVDYLWGGFASASSICILMGLWHLSSVHLGIFLMPEPLTIFSRIGEILQLYSVSDIPITLQRAAIGLSSAVALGIIAGLLAGLSKTMALMMRPLITVLLGMPPIIWVVFALFWFDMGNISTIFTIIITVCPMCFAAAMRAMLSVDEDLKEMMRSYRVNMKRQIAHLYLPHLSDYLLPAIIVAVGSGIKITIMAELLGATDGMGAKIADARVMMDTETVFAYVIITIVIIMAVEYLLLEPIRILLTPWER